MGATPKDEELHGPGLTAAVKAKHLRQEFLSFLRQIDPAYPEQVLHLVVDNYPPHKTPEVKE